MANAKTVRFSKDDVTYYTLPGSSADLSEDSATVDDSIFGTTFTSMQPTLITWNTSSNGFFKGFPGYRATVRRAGVATTFTDEPASLAANGMYYIGDRAKSLWNRAVTVTASLVSPDPVDPETEPPVVTPIAPEDILKVDYLHGAIQLDPSVVVGEDDEITVSGGYFPMGAICKAQSFTLTNSVDTENVTDFCIAQENDGYAVFEYQRQTVELSLEGFYSDTNNFTTDLISRDTVIIEIDPAGNGSSVARGYFRATSRSQSGDVGSTETESVTFMLTVPEGIDVPFSWYHADDSAIPNAIRAILDCWGGREKGYLEYRAENSNVVRKGQVLISDCSLSSGVEEINEFSIDFQGSGELEIVNV